MPVTWPSAVTLVTDKNVRITADKKLSGTKSFPVYVQKNHIV